MKVKEFRNRYYLSNSLTILYITKELLTNYLFIYLKNSII
jgi:hypothetical protein